MRKLRKLFFALAAALIALGVLSQSGTGRHYDPATETTLQGTVSKVLTEEATTRGNGIRLTLHSEGKTWDVLLGPKAYVARQGMSFSVGDFIQAVGSKVQSSGSAVLIAREITREGKVLTLRDRRGVPMWSQGRRGNS